MDLERFPCKQDEIFAFIITPSSLPCQGPSCFLVLSCAFSSSPGCELLGKSSSLPHTPPATLRLKVVQEWKTTELPPERETVLPQAPFCPQASPLQLLFLILTSLFLEIWNTHITGSQVIKGNPETFHKQSTSCCGFFLLPSLGNWQDGVDLYYWLIWAPKKSSFRGETQ